MIACSRCGHENPLGTRFCRGCGEKIVITHRQVASSVERTARDAVADRWRVRAWNAVSIAGFLLACAIVVRVTATPALPPADLPAMPIGAVLPVAAPAQGRGDDAAVPVPAWRSRAAPRVAAECGIDAKAVADLRAALAAAQAADGSWPGSDALAATGLAAYALQCAPGDPIADAAAARGRAWIAAHASDLSRASPHGRLFAGLVLADAGRIDRHRVALCLDASLPAAWRGLLLAAVDAEQRPAAPAELAAAAPEHLRPWFDLLAGRVASASSADLLARLGAAATGDERFLAALAAWHLAGDPPAVLAAIKAWLAAPPAEAGANLAAAGPAAATACALLTAQVPLALRPLWGSAPR